MEKIPVVVTTQHRGVFFGYADEDGLSGSSVNLKQARNCVKWVGTRGFIGLAATGPNEKCRIGPAATEIILHNVTAVLKATAGAAEAWEAAPWN